MISKGLLFIILYSLLLTACETIKFTGSHGELLRYQPQQGSGLLFQHAPLFWVENYQQPYNLIGTVQAETKEDVWVDPQSPVIYAEKRAFSTANDDYVNLIYRVHFEKVPSGFSPFYLGEGKNVGLLVIVTTNLDGQPLLFTTVHICGCYLAMIPTQYLPKDAWPTSWPNTTQEVLGETLPALLHIEQGEPVNIMIRRGSHRVMSIWSDSSAVKPELSVNVSMQALKSLESLPLGEGNSTSFYEIQGSRKGFVKGSYKTRELLLMSWWVLDWNVGQDKQFGANLSEGPVFYTSLQPWYRDDSDMRNFPAFLKFWGWQL